MVLPRHYWEGTDSQGRKRDISADDAGAAVGFRLPIASRNSSLAAPLALERVKDYWGANLPVQVGQNNFDELRFEFFRDDLVALEAFKA